MKKKKNNLVKAIEVIKTEKECVMRNVGSNCNRDCYGCDLIMPDKDILDAYDIAIDAIEKMMKIN